MNLLLARLFVPITLGSLLLTSCGALAPNTGDPSEIDSPPALSGAEPAVVSATPPETIELVFRSNDDRGEPRVVKRTLEFKNGAFSSVHPITLPTESSEAIIRMQFNRDLADRSSALLRSPHTSHGIVPIVPVGEDVVEFIGLGRFLQVNALRQAELVLPGAIARGNDRVPLVIPVRLRPANLSVENVPLSTIDARDRTSAEGGRAHRLVRALRITSVPPLDDFSSLRVSVPRVLAGSLSQSIEREIPVQYDCTHGRSTERSVIQFAEVFTVRAIGAVPSPLLPGEAEKIIVPLSMSGDSGAPSAMLGIFTDDSRAADFLDRTGTPPSDVRSESVTNGCTRTCIPISNGACIPGNAPFYGPENFATRRAEVRLELPFATSLTFRYTPAEFGGIEDEAGRDTPILGASSVVVRSAVD